MTAKQPFRLWKIKQLTTIPENTSKAIVAAYKQKFGTTVWQLFHARIDGRRRYLFPVVCGMLAQLLWVEENRRSPIVDISTNEKMIYTAHLEEFSCEDTNEFHAYLGVFYAWWVDKYKVHQTSRVIQAIKTLDLGAD